MVKDKYLQEVLEKIKKFNQSKNLKFFLFGSCLAKDHFGDLDIGVVGEVREEDLRLLKEEFEDSTLPYSVDIIDFNKVSDHFKNNVFNHKILWITP